MLGTAGLCIVSTMRASLLALLLSLGLASACAERPRRPADRPPAPTVDGPAAHAAVALPPFALSLEGRDDAEGTTLDVTVRVHWAVPAPLSLRLTFPRGATVVEGHGSEEIAAPRAGATLQRRFRVVGADGRRVAVTATQEVPDAVGATATLAWPPPQTKAARRWEPIAPVRHGSLEIREAIRLQPGSR